MLMSYSDVGFEGESIHLLYKHFVQWVKKVSNYFVYSSQFRLLTRKFLCLKLNCYVPDFGTLE
jgi:hypothetical protein